MFIRAIVFYPQVYAPKLWIIMFAEFRGLKSFGTEAEYLLYIDSMIEYLKRFYAVY